MEIHSKPDRIILVVLIILFLHLSGCLSTRKISFNDIPDSEKYHYIVHSKNSEFPIRNAVISGDTLSGKMNFSHSGRKNSINIYPTSDMVIDINNKSILSLPVSEISEVRLTKGAPGRTMLLIMGCVVIPPSAFLFIFISSWPG
jgi:hypothetical protein